MSHRKAYATITLVAALTVAPTAAHAEQVWFNDYGGIDCDHETLFHPMPNGEIQHFPALPYEIESYCGHPPTIDWGDATGPVDIKAATPPRPAAPSAPAPIVVEPEPEPEPVEPRTGPLPGHGHSIFILVV